MRTFIALDGNDEATLWVATKDPNAPRALITEYEAGPDLWRLIETHPRIENDVW